MKLKIAFCSAHTNPFYDEVLRGAVEVAEREGAELLSWQGRLHFPLAAIPYLKPDGLLVGAVPPEELDSQLPRVGFSNTFEHGIRPAVINDDREAGRMAARASVEAGYGSISLLGQSGLWHSRLRGEGVMEEAERLGLPVRSHDMSLRPVGGEETFQDIWEEHQAAFREFLGGLPDNGAVVALGHGNAREALSLLTGTLGRKVPEDAGVLLVDLPGATDGALAHIPLDGFEVGRRAASRLIRRLRGESEPGPDCERIPPRPLRHGHSFRQGEARRIHGRLRSWCAERLAGEISVEDMAREAGLSRRSLEMKLKEGGFPAPYELLTDLRVAEAKRLLRETGLRMEDIAERCGFTDGRALRKRFRARTGKTPREWRRASG